MSGQVRGRVCVVTGAGSGIGRALALELAARRAFLALCDIDDDAVAATAAECARAGAPVVRHDRLDVTDRPGFVTWADDVEIEFGRVDVVVNNAGAALSAPATDTSFADIDWQLDVNLHSVITGSQAFLPALVRSGNGHLVNVSSVLGFVTAPRLSAYCASKFAVRGYTEALRVELRHDGVPVTVSTVHPGGIRTAIARSARVGGPASDEDLGSIFDRVAMTSPERAGRVIADGIERGRARIWIGADARAARLVEVVAGPRHEAVIRALYRTTPLRDAAVPAAGRVSGGLRDRVDAAARRLAQQ